MFSCLHWQFSHLQCALAFCLRGQLHPCRAVVVQTTCASWHGCVAETMREEGYVVWVASSRTFKFHILGSQKPFSSSYPFLFSLFAWNMCSTKEYLAVQICHLLSATNNTAYLESQCHCVAARLKITRLSEAPAELEACICALEFVHCIWLRVSVLVQGLQCHFVTSGWMSNVYTLCYALVCMSNVLKETYRHVGICWRGWDVCKLEHTCKTCCVHIEIKAKCEAWSIMRSIHWNSGISWQARFLRQHCIHALTAFAVCGWQTSGSDWIMASYIPLPLLFLFLVASQHVHFLPWFILTF